MSYPALQMAEYLLPNHQKLSINYQRGIFSLRNRMINISENFPSKQKKEECPCGQTQTMKHLYCCKYLNDTEHKSKYENILFDDVKEQLKVYQHFQFLKK